jgi:hypothetical protein
MKYKTFGEWCVEGEGQKITGILDIGHNHFVCKITGWAQPTQDKIAHLISAAPDMLRALENIPDMVLNCGHRQPNAVCFCCTVKEAIKKANNGKD